MTRPQFDQHCKTPICTARALVKACSKSLIQRLGQQGATGTFFDHDIHLDQDRYKLANSNKNETIDLLKLPVSDIYDLQKPKFRCKFRHHHHRRLFLN